MNGFSSMLVAQYNSTRKLKQAIGRVGTLFQTQRDKKKTKSVLVPSFCSMVSAALLLGIRQETRKPVSRQVSV